MRQYRVCGRSFHSPPKDLRGYSLAEIMDVMEESANRDDPPDAVHPSSGETRPGRRHSSPASPSLWITVCVVATLLLCVGGWMRIRHLRLSALAYWEAQLSNVTDVTKFAIDSWIRERCVESLELAARLAKSPALFAGQQSLDLPQKTNQIRAQAEEDLESAERKNGYSSIWVFDKAGRVLAKSGGAASTADNLLSVAEDAMKIGTEVVRGPRFDAQGKPLLLFAAPVLHRPSASAATPTTLGAVLLAQNPNNFLIPLMSRETIPTATGEYMLVARVDQEFRILSPLRHPPTSAPKIIIPWADAPQIGRTAIESEREFGEFTDFRGVKVIAVTRHISGAVGLIRQIDKSEAFAAYHTQIRTEGLLALAMLATGAFAILAYVRAERTSRLREIASSEARLSGIINAAMDAVIALDSEYRITLFNRTAERIFGCTAKEVLGQKPDSLIPEGLRDAFHSQLKAFRWSGETARFLSEQPELRGLRRSGEEFPIEATLSQLELEGKKIHLAIIRDITQRKRADRLLQQTEEKYRKLFEESKDAVFISSVEGKFLDINPAGVELFGYDSKEELMQIDIPKHLFVHAPDREKLRTLQQAQGFVENFEILAKRKDGTTRTVLETSTAIRDEKGEVLAYRGILRDITERKALEAKFLQAQKMEAIGQLAGGIAHDFNNILTAILGYSDLMRIDLEKDDPRNRLIDEISKAGNRAVSLTQQLLAFSRRQLMQPKILELNILVAEMDQMLRRLISENITLATHLDPELGQVKADPGQIQQVILNLVVNARDAMPEGGRLAIRTSNIDLTDAIAAQQLGATPGRYVMLAVIDSGHGINPEDQSRIFEPFFTTKDKGKGTGLGLSTVYGIVQQSGGFISLQSTPGEGSTFTIYLPQLDAPASSLKPAVITAPSKLTGTETILLVEDEAAVRSLACEILTSYGYHVLEAANGDEAIHLCQGGRRDIHLTLTDIVMPGMSGPQMVRKLKPLYPKMKVLFVSGYSYAEMTKNQALDLGSSFLPKPFTPLDLAKTVRQLLDEDPGASRA